MVDVDDVTAPSGASMLAKLEEREGRNPLEESPHLRTFFACWLETFLLKGKVDPALRERAVLRVMWRCNQQFEWANHYEVARRVGLSDDDIRAIRTGERRPDLPRGCLCSDDLCARNRCAGEIYNHARDLCARYRLAPGGRRACRQPTGR